MAWACLPHHDAFTDQATSELAGVLHAPTWDFTVFLFSDKYYWNILVFHLEHKAVFYLVEGNTEASAGNILVTCRTPLLELSRFGVGKEGATLIRHDGTAGENSTLHPKMDFGSPIMAELIPLTINYFKEILILLWHVGILNLAASLSSTDEKRMVQNGCSCESIKLIWGPCICQYAYIKVRELGLI